MDKKYWFRPKRYGWGFTPISWEGWLATLIFVALIYASVYVNEIYKETVNMEQIIRFLVDILIISTLFTCFAKDKTDGELKWHWGNK